MSENKQATPSQCIKAIEYSSIANDVFYPEVHGFDNGIDSSGLAYVEDILDPYRATGPSGVMTFFRKNQWPME